MSASAHWKRAGAVEWMALRGAGIPTRIRQMVRFFALDYLLVFLGDPQWLSAQAMVNSDHPRFYCCNHGGHLVGHAHFLDGTVDVEVHRAFAQAEDGGHV